MGPEALLTGIARHSLAGVILPLELLCSLLESFLAVHRGRDHAMAPKPNHAMEAGSSRALVCLAQGSSRALVCLAQGTMPWLAGSSRAIHSTMPWLAGVRFTGLRLTEGGSMAEAMPWLDGPPRVIKGALLTTCPFDLPI